MGYVPEPSRILEIAKEVLIMPAPTCISFVPSDRCGYHRSEDNIDLAPCRVEGCPDYMPRDERLPRAIEEAPPPMDSIPDLET
jgi:hypothetical protein